MQEDVAVEDGAITGTLKFIEGGIAETGPLSGDGYFLALKFSDLDERATSVKVGLQPSVSSGLVEIIDDPDKNGVFKISDKDGQKFAVLSSNNYSRTKVLFDLSGLTLEDPGV